jgi:hypothetical protein
VSDQPLSDAEREALDRVIGPDARGAYRTAEDVWAAARAYELADDDPPLCPLARAVAAEQRIRGLREALEGIVAVGTGRSVEVLARARDALAADAAPSEHEHDWSPTGRLDTGTGRREWACACEERTWSDDPDELV